MEIPVLFLSELDDVLIFFLCQLAQCQITLELVFADVTQFVFFFRISYISHTSFQDCQFQVRKSLHDDLQVRVNRLRLWFIVINELLFFVQL